MSEDNYGAQVSVKFGNGSMVNLRADDVDGLIEEQTKFNAAADFFVKSAEDLQGLAVVQQAFPGATVVDHTPTQPPQASYGGGGAPAGPVCAHGAPMEWKQGTSNNGKAYKGYFCTVKNDPRLAQCPPQWAR